MAVISEKRPKNINAALLIGTFEHRNFKRDIIEACDEGFPKLLSLISSCKGQRSSGAIISAKMAPKL